MSAKKELLINFFKNKYNLALIGILILAFILRLKYFNINLSVWWDEGNYLNLAKKIGLSLWENLDIKDIWSPRRPFLLPLLWAAIYKIGGTEIWLRFTQLIFSMFGVFLVYLLGKEMFSRKVGLIAALMMAVLWDHLFFTARLLVDVPGTTFVLACYYFFWKGYVNDKGKKFIFIAALFLALAVFTRAATFLIIIPIIIYILTNEKLKFIKNKNLWISLIIFLLVLSPFVIWTTTTYEENPLKKITGIGENRFNEAARSGISGVISFIGRFPLFFKWPFLAPFIVGLYIFFDLFIAPDLILKDKEIRKKLFLLLSILVPLFFFGWFTETIEERYLMYMFPMVFIVAGIGLMKVYKLLKPYSKAIALIIIFMLLIVGAYQQIVFADNSIKAKEDSGIQLKEAALWMKERTVENDVIFNNGVPQNLYYSERYTFTVKDTPEETKLYIDELNKQGYKMKYYVISLLERSPQWAYTYPDEHTDKFKPVQVYYDDPQKTQLVLVIYEFLTDNI